MVDDLRKRDLRPQNIANTGIVALTEAETCQASVGEFFLKSTATSKSRLLGRIPVYPERRMARESTFSGLDTWKQNR